METGRWVIRTVDDILRWYNAIILLVLVLLGDRVEGRWLLAAIHLAAFLLLPRLTSLVGGRGFTMRAVAVRGVVVAIFLPLVFSETGLLLPAVNTFPGEWHALKADLAILGGRDIWSITAPLRCGWGPEILILCYSTFYFLPILLFIRLARRRELGPCRELLVAVTFGFAASYLLYLVFPVLCPYVALEMDHLGDGGGLFRAIISTLDGMEVNKRDCFPSGHTWLTLTVMHLAWLRDRRLFYWLLPVASGLLLATVTLRFHYLVDLVAGAILYLPALKLSRWLDREGGAGWGRRRCRSFPINPT